MKILFIIPSIAKGGQEKAGMLLCNYLMNFHDLTVVCFEKENKNDFDYKCKIVRIDISSGSSFYKKSLGVLKRLNALKALKKQIKPDCSIAFGNTAIILNGFTGIGEKRVSSVRQSFYNLMAQNSLGLKIHRYLYVSGLKKSDRIVSVSNDINLELKEFFSIKNDYFVNNGFDIDFIQQQASEPIRLFAGDGVRLAHAGSFNAAKAHWHLIRVFAEVKKHIKNARLLLLGGEDQSTGTGSEIIKYCKNYLERNGFTWSEDEGRDVDVLFLGHQKNPYKYLAKSDLFIFPSIWEGFPNALVEAMCCRLPVVAADCPTGPRNILINKETGEEYGLLLPAFQDNFDPSILSADKNDEYWATQLIKLLSDQSALDNYKIMAEKRAAHFAIHKMGEKWNNILTDL